MFTAPSASRGDAPAAAHPEEGRTVEIDAAARTAALDYTGPTLLDWDR